MTIIQNVTSIEKYMRNRNNGEFNFKGKNNEYYVTFSKHKEWEIAIYKKIKNNKGERGEFINISINQYSTKKKMYDFIKRKTIELGLNSNDLILSPKDVFSLMDDKKTETKETKFDTFINELIKEGVKDVLKPYKVNCYTTDGIYSSYGKGDLIQPVDFKGENEYYEIIFDKETYGTICFGDYNNIDLDFDENKKENFVIKLMNTKNREIKNSKYIKQTLKGKYLL